MPIEYGINIVLLKVPNFEPPYYVVTIHPEEIGTNAFAKVVTDASTPHCGNSHDVPIDISFPTAFGLLMHTRNVQVLHHSTCIIYLENLIFRNHWIECYPLVLKHN
jgi:hypothetical protein